MRNDSRTGAVLTRILPVLVWVAALAGVVALYAHRSRSFRVVGIATAQTADLTAIDSGVLISLPVQLYQEVRKGQPVAVVQLVPDTENQYNQARFEAEKATALAQLESLKAEAAAAEKQIQLDRSRRKMEGLYREHQLALDVEKARLQILEIQATLEPLKIQWKDLQMEKQVLQDLVDKNAIEPYELQKVTFQAEAMAEQIARQQRWLEQSRQDLEKADRRLETFRSVVRSPDDGPTDLLEPLHKAITVQEKRLAELFVPDQEITLTAPFDGVVASVYYSEGQTVIRDLPILTISARQPDRIVAWVDQHTGGSLAPRQPVQIIKTSLPRKVLQSQIFRIGPRIELMPERLWQDPAVPQWGRPVVIPILPEMQLTPNEIVGIRGI